MSNLSGVSIKRMTHLAVLLVLCIVGQPVLAYGQAPRKPPNIVIITADDMGWHDVGFHGSNQIPTPNIDALAYDGIILNRHYSAPMCTPSRAALMTGRNPINVGMQHYVIDSDEPWGLGLDQRIMPEYFRAAGYRTHMIGKWHLGFFTEHYIPTNRGFDTHIGYLGPYVDYWSYVSKMNSGTFQGYDMRQNRFVNYAANGTYATDYFTMAAKDIIAQHGKSEEPMLLVLNHLAPHAGNDDDPLQAPQETIDKFTYIQNRDRRTYAAMMSKLDDSVGAVYESLKVNRMLHNSIIVFLSDNGGVTRGMHSNTGSNYPFRGQKHSPWEGAVRTAALIWSPLLQDTQRVSNQWFHISDWLPTLASAAGIKVGNGSFSDIDGIDQWEALAYGTGNPRQRLMNNLDEIFGYTSYMENGFKYINGTTLNGVNDEWYGETDAFDKLPTDDQYLNGVMSTTIAKAGMLDEKLITYLRRHARVNCGNAIPTKRCNPLVKPCLFDIINDPCEMHDISSQYPRKLREIRQHLEHYRARAVKPRNRPHDPEADPTKFGGVWNWWRTDPTRLAKQDDEIPPPSHSLAKDTQLFVIIPIVVVGIIFVFGTLLYLSNKNLIKLCRRKKQDSSTTPSEIPTDASSPDGKATADAAFSSKIYVISDRDLDSRRINLIFNMNLLMKITFLGSLWLATSINFVKANSLEYDGWLNIALFHALDIDEPNKFTLRGNVTVTNRNTGLVSVAQEPLSLQDRNKLKRLAQENRLYRLEAHVTDSDGVTKFLTSSKACALAKAQLTDVLWVSLDHSGMVTAVTQSVNNGNMNECRDLSNTDVDVLDEFNTDVYVKHTESAPIPDTASFIQKMEREREARERGETKDNRSFFAKYWMYLVPVVILLLISATNPEAGQR
ncbi:arylsulfatase B-like [Anopheles maculipalpis]|uniref:arylsulfatase B-like n=1 Tax=Anopheles maculipalpis TaxID=1496333 RepID=UPI0021593187|nr:arylsulfatase B-like [Anopheles maculipalpis]